MIFEIELEKFLHQENLVFSKSDSVFPFYKIENHHLVLHCISLKKFSKAKISDSYFANICDDLISKKMKVIHLWEDVWQNENELVKNRILAVCGKSKRIHARQTEVKRLNKKETDAFLNANHLQHTTNAYYKYGLMLKDELVAVATFSKSRVMNDGPVLYRSYELVRFCSLKGTTVNGGLSKLLKHFIVEHHPAHIMTYADKDWSSGESYTKNGFAFLEKLPPQFFFIHPDKMIRIYAHRLDLTEKELLAKGYLKIVNSGNAKFILDRRK